MPSVFISAADIQVQYRLDLFLEANNLNPDPWEQSELGAYVCNKVYLSHGMIFPTMWNVRPAKPQISLCIRAVGSEPLLVV